MWYLIGEIAIYLVTGFCMGTVVGWFFRGADCKRNLNGLHAYWTGRVKTMDRLNVTTRQHLEQAGQQVEELEGTLKEKLAALQRVAKSLGEAESRMAELGRERDELVLQAEGWATRERETRAELEITRRLLATRERELDAATSPADELEPLADRRVQRMAGLDNGGATPDTTGTDTRRNIEIQPVHLDDSVTEVAGHAEEHSNGRMNGRREAHAGGGNGQKDSGIPATRDDLRRIRGIGRVFETKLNHLGIYTFQQIAEWTPEDVDRIAERLSGSHGRIARDRWVRQARNLARQKN
jgi:predicted flap endonuclease-1-like 5' DNA nuclease